MKVKAIKTHKIKPNKDTDLCLVLNRYLPKLKEGSVIAVTSKIVAICEGRFMKVGEVDKDEIQVASSDGNTPQTTKKEKVVFRGFKKVKKKTDLGLQSSFELMKELFADLRRGSGAVVISSASGVEYALESDEWNNGVFTYSFLQGIKTGQADANGDGDIRVSELMDYISLRVGQLTKGKQHPTSRRENSEFDFVIWSEK